MIFSYLLNMQSHPSWVCGLKLLLAPTKQSKDGSHPSWVCGLKPQNQWGTMGNTCHTLRGCVDWNSFSHSALLSLGVTPFVGVWIETSESSVTRCASTVTPFVGVWIETWLGRGRRCPVRHTLRGCVDWNFKFGTKCIRQESHTLRGCVDWN